MAVIKTIQKIEVAVPPNITLIKRVLVNHNEMQFKLRGNKISVLNEIEIECDIETPPDKPKTKTDNNQTHKGELE